MTRRPPAELPTWMLFALPAGIAVPIVAGIVLGGPIAGFVVAGLVAAAIVVVAIRADPERRRAAAPDDENWRAAAARRFLVPLVLAVAGIVLAVVAEGTVRDIGWGVIAIAVTVAVSLVFLEVGLSEDRERARDERMGR